MPTALTQHDVAIIWSLLEKEKSRILRRGRRTSETSAQFIARGAQYDETMTRLSALAEEFGPLPGLKENGTAPEPTASEVVRATISRVAPSVPTRAIIRSPVRVIKKPS